MKTKQLLIFLFGMCAFYSYCQSSLLKYPNLTKMSLDEFFMDWKNYSDSVYSNNVIEDSVLADIIRREYAEDWLINDEEQDTIVPQYRVYPEEIRVERYYLDVDTVKAKLELGFPSYIPELKKSQYVVYGITPFSLHRGLYINSRIYKVLSAFAGGLKDGYKITKINKDNVRHLKRYISVNYGHWGGYWWFTSFPMVTDIFYANNLIAVARRTSWCTGDVIWYVRENDNFVRRKEPVNYWIE